MQQRAPGEHTSTSICIGFSFQHLLEVIMSLSESLSEYWSRLYAATTNSRAMATLEYALVCVAAAAFAGLLYVIITSGSVESALRDIIESALSKRP